MQIYSKLSSVICFNLDQSKILSSGNGLITIQSINTICRCIYLLFIDHSSNVMIILHFTMSVYFSVFQCALDMAYWTAFNHIVVWGSIIFYFCFILAFYASVFNYSYQGVAFKVFASGSFWLTLILTCVILIIPVVAYRFYQTNIKATLSDRVRMKQRLSKSKSRSRDMHIRRTSTFRRSQRSMRSGYAFAHQQGFGDLITSGLNMRDRASSVQLKSPVTLTNVKKMQEATSVRQNGNKTALTIPNTVEDHESSEKILYSVKL